MRSNRLPPSPDIANYTPKIRLLCGFVFAFPLTMRHGKNHALRVGSAYGPGQVRALQSAPNPAW